jgi:hypothetical protein
LAALAGGAVMWGLLISTVAGATSGTAAVPVLGTFFGAVMGAIYGLFPTAVGAALVITAVWPQWPVRDRGAVQRTLGVALLLFGLSVQVAVYPFLRFGLYGANDADSVWAPTLAVAPVLIVLLPRATRALTQAYVRHAPTVPGREEEWAPRPVTRSGRITRLALIGALVALPPATALALWA